MSFIRRSLLVLLMFAAWPSAGMAQRFVPRLPGRPPVPAPRFVPRPHIVPVHASAQNRDGQNDDSTWVMWLVCGVLVVASIGLIALFLAREKPSTIRIIDMPPGEAPDYIRSAWIGLELPILHDETGPRTTEQFEVISLQKTGAMSGYVVDGNKAVELLAAHNSNAADWWRENCGALLEAKGCLIFPPDVCEKL